MGIRKRSIDDEFQSITDAFAVASSVYEREQMDAEGMGGSVATDIAGLSIPEMEDYFGDTDPAEYL